MLPVDTKEDKDEKQISRYFLEKFNIPTGYHPHYETVKRCKCDNKVHLLIVIKTPSYNSIVPLTSIYIT